MHGIYKVKVEDQSGRCPVAEFYTETHPLVGGVLATPDGRVWNVKRVTHVLKNARNGGSPVYATFDYVLIVVTTDEEF